LLRFSDGTYTDTFISTIGVDFKTKRVPVTASNGKPYEPTLQIWDTAGQESFRNITISYYRKADGVLLVYDVSDPNSFLKIQSWLQEIKENAPQHTIIMLVGNKVDVEKRVVTSEKAATLAENLKLKYMETSAKTGLGVSEVFNSLAEQVMNKWVENNIKPDAPLDIIQPTKDSKPNPCAC